MSTASTTQSPADRLMDLLVALLAPMFLWSADGDVALARTAAAETIGAYGLNDRLSLIRAAKIIAFDLATLSSLSLSMADDLAVTMALRLRSNANSLDRTAERNRAALEQDRRNAALITQAADVDSVADAVQQAQPRPQTQPPAAKPAPKPDHTDRAPMTGQQRKSAWAGAMADVAAELKAGLGSLPPAEREAEMERIEALTRTAGALASGAAVPPGR
jgi:hypothetical protein